MTAESAHTTAAAAATPATSSTSTSTARAKGKVICKDGRVFHACEVCRKKRSRCDGARPQCTSCRTRGLPCEYRAMRKRGRHGKRDTPRMRSPPQQQQNQQQSQQHHHQQQYQQQQYQHHMPLPITTATPTCASDVAAAILSPSTTADALNLLTFPRFFSLPADIPMHTAGGAMDPATIGSMAPPQHHHHQQQQRRRRRQLLQRDPACFSDRHRQ
ncbi:hypothetical protein GGI11_000565 [Coemansia sp. RSA 2049]|nr:hypothetical protein GGI11_000565 [Coemansia sp. RSA 2049]